MSFFSKISNSVTSGITNLTAPTGERDNQFEESRHFFTKHQGQIESMRKAVKKHEDALKAMLAPWIEFSDSVELLYSGSAHGDQFASAMKSFQAAYKEYMEKNISALEYLKSETKRLDGFAKEIVERDKIKAEMDKMSKEVAKGNKDAVKQRENEAKYKSAKELYDRKNPELTEQLRKLYEDRCKAFEESYTQLVTAQLHVYRTGRDAFKSMSLSSVPPPSGRT